MQFYRTLIAMLSIMAVAGASPTAITDSDPAPLEIEERELVKRDGHQANVYSQLGCSNGYIESVYNFGCGGECHTYNQGVSSVYLQYSGSGNKPTAACYTSHDCGGSINTSSGIAKGQKSGCTAQHDVVYSCYFYYGC